MIEFCKCYQFENNLGGWSVLAETFEHPTDYGNGMLLHLDTKGPKPVMPVTFDIRYEPLGSAHDIDCFVKGVLRERFGAEL